MNREDSRHEIHTLICTHGEEGYARTCLGLRESGNFSFFLLLALWGTTQTILSTSAPASASTCSLQEASMETVPVPTRATD